MAKTGKRLKKAYEGLDPEAPPVRVEEAVKQVKSRASAKFDETVEIAMNLNLDPRKQDQNLRGTVMLPHGTGKSVRVAVFARGDRAKEAEAAGADIVGAEDLATRVQEGFADFDVVIATPDMMGIVGRLGRILGPQGKMPNPKSGTITFEIAKAVEDVKSGKIEYRTENRAGLIHVAIGKRSFEEAQLVENHASVLEELLRVRPASAKGRYIKTITLASTMGPGIKLDPTRTRDLLEEKESAPV
jgi:large subunit ribosomal protein L1